MHIRFLVGFPARVRHLCCAIARCYPPGDASWVTAYVHRVVLSIHYVSLILCFFAFWLLGSAQRQRLKLHAHLLWRSSPSGTFESPTWGEYFADTITEVDHCWEAAWGDMSWHADHVPVRTEGSGTQYDGRVWYEHISSLRTVNGVAMEDKETLLDKSHLKQGDKVTLDFPGVIDF